MTDPVTVEPCPFCGDTPEIAAIPTAIALMLHHPPGDRRCPLSDKVFLGNAWNTRASPSREPGEAAVERVARALDDELLKQRRTGEVGYYSGHRNSNDGYCGEARFIRGVDGDVDLLALASAALTLPEQPRPVDDVERETPGAREAFSALDIADSLIERAYGVDTPKEWHDQIAAVAKARAALGHKDRGGE